MILRFLTLLFCLANVKPDPLPYAEWAHYHMVWLHNSHTNQMDITNMFNDYTNHNITFGSINIDMNWATHVNTFIFNPTTFPTVRNMFDNFRAQNKHIILWMNSFIDTDSPNYQYAQDHGYLFNKTIKWGHGEGRLLNYFDEKAVDWWHSQIERLIDTVGPIHAFKV
jgi:alpha-glucosidase (family GH31 glycosyl hydrolase)